MEQHSERLQAGELCFARLIGLLLGDLGQRPMHRAPSTAGGCNAEASRRYLLEDSGQRRRTRMKDETGSQIDDQLGPCTVTVSDLG
jgi:hypothetical protein